MTHRITPCLPPVCPSLIVVLSLWGSLACSDAEEGNPSNDDVTTGTVGDGSQDLDQSSGVGDGDATGTGGGAVEGTGGNGAGGSPSGTGGDTGGAGDELDAPATVEGLQDLFVNDLYGEWAAELDYHISDGPHGTGVKVYYSPKAAAAVQSGAASLPVGSAIVKELTWNSQKSGIYGWDAMVKVADEGAASDWFWYELQGTPEAPTLEEAGERGYSGCVGCHSPGVDYVVSSLAIE